MIRYVLGIHFNLWHLHEFKPSYNLFCKYGCTNWNNPYGWTRLRQGNSQQFHPKVSSCILKHFLMTS